MNPRHDLVIRNGLVFDGSGGAARTQDIAIDNGRIAAMGDVAGSGREELDARDRIVTPGFVDIHTHYDGQATWDQRLTPSAWHGVTTAVMGNCGVGFAPCRESDHDRLIRLMEGVEDIPNAVLTEGLAWNWQTFPEYLDALEAIPHDIDFAAQLPHGALRVYVMGERGARREVASPHDIDAMARIAADAIRAGALGFSTSRTLNHRTSDGELTPTFSAEADELAGIALGLKRAGAGVLQVISDFTDPAAETAMLRRMVTESGRPLSFSLAQSDRSPDGWKNMLAFLDQCATDGLPVRAQVCGRPVGLLLGLSLTLNPFSAHPAWKEIEALPLDRKLAILRTPDMRARMLSGEPASDNPFVRAVLRNFEKMFPLADPPDYEPPPETSLGAVARRQNRKPEDVAYDWLLQDNGRSLILFPFLNYASGDLEPSREMMNHPLTILGLGDGGAHVGMICDGSFPTSMLTHWTRDRTRGARLKLEQVIKAQCFDTARAVGLHDRGLLQPGYKADLNIIDYDRLRLHRPTVAHDLPAGGRRLVQFADGYDATIVSGQVTYRQGIPTSALPGKLIRGGTQRP
jgi:N-acyl-D-aspartate/D-glutamate deacylase